MFGKFGTIGFCRVSSFCCLAMVPWSWTESFTSRLVLSCHSRAGCLLCYRRTFLVNRDLQTIMYCPVDHQQKFGTCLSQYVSCEAPSFGVEWKKKGIPRDNEACSWNSFLHTNHFLFYFKTISRKLVLNYLHTLSFVWKTKKQTLC